jgi:triosephosphate isomerase (TIM)
MVQKKSASRNLVIAANWKMHKTIDESLLFVKTLAPLIKKSQARVFIAPPFTSIAPMAHLIKQDAIPMTLGAQNMNDEDEGAFTGEISAKMLKDAGAQFVILGHSERRHIYHEDDTLINKKILRACKEKLRVIFCVGELAEERDRGETEKILEKQIVRGLKTVTKEAIFDIMLAYEPVWAIGTGKVAHPENAEKAHQFCRSIIETHFGQDVASQFIILYGGSVQAENAPLLVSMNNIDGLLVGGASLKVESFSQIILRSGECLV